MKKGNLWTVLFAFCFGQAIQLVTNAMAHYLYVSDPVMMCITVGIVTVALVILTAIFTLMGEQPEGEHTMAFSAKRETFSDVIPPIFRDWRKRPSLDTDGIDITEEDDNIRKENDDVLFGKAH